MQGFLNIHQLLQAWLTLQGSCMRNMPIILEIFIAGQTEMFRRGCGITCALIGTGVVGTGVAIAIGIPQLIGYMALPLIIDLGVAFQMGLDLVPPRPPRGLANPAAQSGRSGPT
jgi:hypothetical protein